MLSFDQLNSKLAHYRALDKAPFDLLPTVNWPNADQTFAALKTIASSKGFKVSEVDIPDPTLPESPAVTNSGKLTIKLKKGLGISSKAYLMTHEVAHMLDYRHTAKGQKDNLIPFEENIAWQVFGISPQLVLLTEAIAEWSTLKVAETLGFDTEISIVYLANRSSEDVERFTKALKDAEPYANQISQQIVSAIRKG